MNTKVTAAMLAADVDAKIAAIAAVAAPGFSAGMSAIWRGSALPSGWLWEDGAKYSLRKKHIPWDQICCE